MDTAPCAGPLSTLAPLDLSMVRRTPDERLYKSLIHRWHYLGYAQPVGEHLEYVAFSGGRPVACIGFSSAPRHIGVRDRHLGWTKEERIANLHKIVVNTRFLILPWVKVPHLASHLLGQIAKRISRNWERVYRHRSYGLRPSSTPRGDLRGPVIRPPAGAAWDLPRAGARTTMRKSLIEVSSMSSAVPWSKTSERPSMAYCKDCIEKDLKITELQETVKGLKAQLRYRERKEEDGAFGLSTPSSKKPFKENASEEKTHKKGGAVPGHTGHGRTSLTEETADLVIDRDAGEVCPECGIRSFRIGKRRARSSTMLPGNRRRCCTAFMIKCARTARRSSKRRPLSFQKSLRESSHCAGRRHALLPRHPHGENLRDDRRQPGKSGRYLPPPGQVLCACMEALKNAYRQDPAKHADETGWRNDGQSGYAWLFCTGLLSIFLFKNTRSSSIPRGVFGNESLPGVLVVDRYNGYNKLPVKLQYCYAHLLRDLEKLGKDFLDEEEVKSFAGTLILLLAQAMHLNSQNIPDKEYYRKAKKLRKEIMKVCRSPARHLGIRAFQDIFVAHGDRLFHWVEDRRVPAHNNRAERELRPTVIARKVSFGSSSDAGAETRSILMSVLHTLNKGRGKGSLESVFKEILDRIADDLTVDVASLILPAQKLA